MPDRDEITDEIGTRMMAAVDRLLDRMPLPTLSHSIVQAALKRAASQGFIEGQTFANNARLARATTPERNNDA